MTMKIALSQQNFIIGDIDHNVSCILNKIEEGKKQGVGLVLFTELSVCGYPPRDFLEFHDFTNQCMQAVEHIAQTCVGIAAIVGAPSRNMLGKGKPLYNSAFFLADGKIHGMAHKTLLPNYDVFDEYRYFEPNRVVYQVIPYQGVTFALTICEDLWNTDDFPLYVRNPMDELIRLHPDVIINIAASPFHYNQPQHRRDVLSLNAKKYQLPVFYVNQVGGQTELLFDGGSMVVTHEGNVYEELYRFREDWRVYDLEEIRHPDSGIRMPDAGCRMMGELSEDQASGIGYQESLVSLIHDALVMGIRDYFRKMDFSRAILGLSGGIDSAVTLALAVEALGKENARAMLLPSRFSSEHSIRDAHDVAERLGVVCDILSIEDAFQAVEKSLEPYFQEMPFGLAEENIQARIRAVILMAMANKFGYILLNTSNKSEAAVGYGTLYGDMCGGISVLGDVYKTQVYELAEYINRHSEIIPLSTILKPPSAELKPDQLDSDILPDYPLLDNILIEYIEHRKGLEELIHTGFDPVVVKKVLRMVNTSEWKRYQTPPILRVSPKAFGMGRRMPIVGKYPIG